MSDPIPENNGQRPDESKNTIQLLEETPEQLPVRYVVGIGASAGGLEALTQFVAALPSGLECAYVVIQHLSPSYKSMMASLLARETMIPVCEITDQMPLQKSTIYVAPPKWDVIYKDGRLCLEKPADDNTQPKPSINRFFQSIAENLGERAVGIVLSGTGSDGTLGIRDIKTYGGLTFAQTPETAKYEGMPRSAIDSGRVDRILPPAQIAEKLSHIIDLQLRIQEEESVEQDDHFFSILSTLQKHSGIDFHDYKKSTLQRRIQRRIVACECTDISHYRKYLETHPAELDELGKEILISVTSFFRDKEAFDDLRTVINELLRTHGEGDFRIWVAGCATGEEAYSIGILCSEYLDRNPERINLQLFATDIDLDALAVARRGLYPASSLADVPAHILNKYFTPRGNFLEVNKSLRDKLVFARQDMTSDPPFMRLDLISCRNVLIYMTPKLQSKVLSTFHYALRPDGILFLGRSENVSREDSLFKIINSRSRIYKKIRNHQTPLSALMTQLGSKQTNGLRKGGSGTLPAENKPPETLLSDLLISDYSPTAAIFNKKLEVLHIHNSNPAFFRMPSSGPVIQLLQLLHPEFHSEAQSLIHMAIKKKQPVHGHIRKTDNEWKRIVIHPVSSDDEYFVIIFQSAAGNSRLAGKFHPAETETEESLSETDLRYELETTRETLQTVIEELETSNEEMQALNEEIQAANEELQASNEELEASNEELQATNQELISLNEELETRTKQITALSAEYEFLYNSLDMPILVFSKEGVLTRTNRSAVQQFGLGPGSAGLAVIRLSLPPPLDNLSQQIEEVLKTGKNLQIPAEVQDRSYIVNLNPGYSKSGEIEQIFVFITDHTNIIRYEKQLKEKKDQLQAIIDHSFLLLAVKDTAGRYQFANRRFLKFFDLPENIQGKTDLQLFSDEAQAKMFRSGDAEVIAQVKPVFSTLSISRNGIEHILDTVRFPLLDESGTPYAVCTQMEDVTLKKHAEEQLRLAAKVFHHSGEGISITDPSGKIITVNESFTRVTGYDALEVIGKTPAILKSGKHDKDFYKRMWDSIREKGWWQGEVWNRKKNGTVYPEWLTINAVYGADGSVTHYVGIFSDITAIKESQKRVAYLASHDELTGLANRNLFNDELRHALGRASRRGYKAAIMYLDIDNFKTINDTLGHETGDLLLKEVAKRLKESVRDGDLVVRMGGDEFVLLLEDILPETIRQIAERVIDYLSASFVTGGHQLFITCSMGISVFPDDGEDSRTLLKNADVAMYRAKDAGRNQYQYFTGEMQVLAQKRLTIQTGLRNALENSEFSLLMQPKVSLADGSIVSAEALMRWNSNTLGPQSPAEFIPIAESTGLINRIDDWVIEKVCQTLSGWKNRGRRIVPVAVNLSPVHFRRGGILETLEKNLAKYGLQPGDIILEVTEGALMDSRAESDITLRRLREAGFHISIDDFGTGYSSLSYLKKYPIDELKIDRSFVDGIENDRSITSAIVMLARSLGLKTVAEGAETERQVQILREIGCDYCQGYYFYRPMKPEELEKLL